MRSWHWCVPSRTSKIKPCTSAGQLIDLHEVQMYVCMYECVPGAHIRIYIDTVCVCVCVFF